MQISGLLCTSLQKYARFAFSRIFWLVFVKKFINLYSDVSGFEKPGGPRNILARARPEPEFCNSKPALGPRAYSEGPPEARRAFINVNSMKNDVIFLLRKTIFLKSGHFRN